MQKTHFIFPMNIVKKLTENVLLLRGTIFLALTLIAFMGVWIYTVKFPRHPFTEPLLTKIQLRDKVEKLKKMPMFYAFKQNEVTLEGFQENVILDYTFDPALQSTAEDLLSQYKPDLGVIVLMDATTGQILAMAGENRGFEVEDDSLGSRTFPSASVFKVVTAAAAIEEQKANPYTLIPYSGRDHTLYKSQLKDRVGGWRRISSLKDAFAKSINTVFGRIGVFSVGKEPLKTFSSKYGFDEAIPSEFPISMSHSANPEDSFELAEMASGYTQNNVMSPIHGAMIAAAVANDGVMMQPYFLNGAYLKSGKAIYKSQPAVFSKVMTPETSAEMRTMMKETITAGTSRKVFRGFFKGKFSDLEVGGKNGPPDRSQAERWN